MRTKITLILALLILPFISNKVFSQTVTGTPSNTGCQSQGIITSSSTGLGATPQYQLLKAGVVVSPVPGDNTQFSTNPVFTGLSSGIYVVNARATSGGTVYSSANITVTDGYTAMTVTTPTKVANCVGGTGVLTSTVTNGKAPFTYKIATQSAPATILQNSGPITPRTFTFTALPANNYIVSVTDSCGQTITGATSIANPTITIDDIKIATIAYPMRPGLSCTDAIRLYIERGFYYTASNTIVSAADAALFRWKIKFQGQEYGQDTNSDGYADIGGEGFLLSNLNPTMPIIANRNNVTNDISNMRVVLMDMCGKSKEFIVTNYNTVYSSLSVRNCAGNAIVRSSIVGGLDCLPVDVTMTNASNSADTHSFVITSASAQNYNIPLTPGGIYNVTFKDGEGYTTGLFTPASNRLTFSATSAFAVSQSPQSVASLNNLDYGSLYVGITPYQATDVLSYTVTASNNPLVAVGYAYSAQLSAFTNGSSGTPRLPSPNPTDPQPYWPKGNYTLQISTDCGAASLNVIVPGRTASLSGNTTTPVCGGFNYVMNGNFDDPTAYQVIIVSGPSSVGQVRDLASSTASLPFNGLSYGTYVFGLRIKGGSVNVLTQTITYDANNAIIVDKTNTGGYVCATGATNGVLTITAASNSPAPGNVLEYALSTDGGSTFGAYQSNNTFSGLTDNTYYFRIKDGCGNVITQSVQIGVAAAPDATADGLNTPAVICDKTSGTVHLDVDVFGAISYQWTGPGINASNQGQKDPLINYSDLTVGANNYTCTVRLGAPCNSSTVSTLTINVNERPTVVTTAPAAVCFPNTIDITAPEITAGSSAGLTYTYFLDEQATIPVTDPTAISVRDTYYIKGTNGNGCFTITPVDVIVNDLPLATINYTSTPYCQTGTTLPEQLGTAGGTYSSDANLVIDVNTGEIDLEASALGSHTITYTFSDGSCSNTVTTDMTINALPTASINYPNGPYCNRGTATSVETGITSGKYSSDPGLSIDELTGDIDLGASTPGTYTVTYEFSNGICSNSTTATITINQTTLPSPLADVRAECSITPVAPMLTDLCAGNITGTTPTVFPITTQGTTTVAWTFDYGNGYVQTVNQNVIIDDTIAPVAPVLADVTEECSVSLVAPTAMDNCAGVITGTTTTVFPITTQGTTIVTWIFNDGNGNIATANQNVIIKDITLPTVPVLADVQAQCSASVTPPTATDNCSGTITGNTNTVFPITTQGTTVVVWTFDDGNGNIATANQNVIILDNIDPILPILPDVTATCSASLIAPITTDNCAGTITGTTNTVFPITAQGTTVVTWTFDDGNGNIVTANQNVIISDTTAPVAPVLADIIGQCFASPAIPSAIDNCAGSVLGTTTTTFPITTQGTTIVTWIFDDGNGNISTANQNVILNSAIQVPTNLPDITEECEVTLAAPATAVNCSNVIIGTTTTVFPITTQGTTIVTWTFDDGNGNISTANQNVIIKDVTAPTVQALSDITAECSVSPSIPTAIDNCAGIISGTTSTVFPITTQGTTIVTWSFDDGNGNIATVNQNVIIKDTEAPIAPVLADIQEQCSATPAIPAAIDACAGIISGTTTTIFPITTQGTTVVTWSFDDGNGNISTANQNVIINDTTPPIIPILDDVNGECEVTLTAPSTVDNCSKTIIGTTSTVFPITTQGTTVVTWTFDNGNNSVVTANQNVIIKDTSAPVAPILEDVYGDCEVTLSAPTAIDNCSGIIIGTSSTVFPVITQGTTVITWTFDDGNGNITTANQNVIIDDAIAPPAPVLADATGDCSVTLTAPTTVDNCAGPITGTTTTIFPITAPGTSIVTWSFDDGNGNISTSNQNVIINDETPPVVPILADVTGECSVIPPVPTTIDACMGTITGTTTSVFPITDQGTTQVTWSFNDGNGNISTAIQNVIIDDITPPVVPVLTDVTAECSVASLTAPTAIDNCAGTITGTTAPIFPITAQGTTVITWIFDDGNGNISIANQNVIIRDITAPTVPILADVTTECSVDSLTIPTAADNCAGIIEGITATVFPITAQGTTVVTWTFDDGNGNISTANQNVIIDDITPPTIPMLADITGQCNVTPAIPTTTDACAGIITGTTTTAFPITNTGTTVITWTFNDGNGNSVTANQNVIISQIALAGAETVACSATQSGYNITLSVTGQPPYTATGTGAPGTWLGNTWTSGLISSGTNYNVNVQDASACNTVNVTGISPNCCRFSVICPTFQASSVQCYEELPSAVSLTEAEFEALGNGDGRIADTRCGVVEITASNGADPGCNANVTRTYTITEYEDTNSNGVRDAGENTVIDTATCAQTILIHDTTAPVFVETLPEATITADCDTIPPAPAFTATDNCGSATVAYDEQRVDGDCVSRYSLIRTWTASDNCGNQNSFVQTVNVSCVEEVYNAVSANGDGLNDSFFIKGIDCYPNNVVRIYNRYGVVVYEKKGYDNVTSPFQGFSDGRATVARGNKLPTGTYFYTLEYDSNGRKVEKAGYLYVNSQ
ncbi:gliding motility-associated C-terminal domain-containing protein [Flavobacterium sp. SH_e]|uniref:gliding motility-associated C-terminal domain-containing protein n=1 Tax=Flavobacterium sp. SH_e TaxID=2983767 RepID=UPI0021E3D75C|nr:gliding motility-associated C-terminal domain-containing protein [Flavobacterium sp. SH_e]MCV2484142.1 gliding motility-associated C-terminal domain-containing protein [Flavobacterium sp. SH_e]